MINESNCQDEIRNLFDIEFVFDAQPEEKVD
jgi:hypothetical protein